MGTLYVSTLAQCAVLAVFGTAILAHAEAPSGEQECKLGDKSERCLEAEKARIKKVRESVFDPLDAASVSSVDVECAKEGAVLGALNCEAGGKDKSGFIKVVEQMTKRMLAVRNEGYYVGRRVNQAAGIAKLGAVPVCNITQGEGEDLGAAFAVMDKTGTLPDNVNKNWLPEKHDARSCGKPCGMKIETGMFSGSLTVDDDKGNCDWEYGQYRGAFVQAQNFHKEKVFREFESKKVTLVDIEGSKPCQENAADVVRLQKGVAKVTQEAVDNVGSKEAVAKLKCPSGGSGAEEPDMNAIGACHMVNANLNLAVLFSKFLDCEVYWRASKDVEAELSSQDEFVKSVKAYIKPICEGAGSCKRQDGSSACDGPFCCSDGLRTKVWNECYTKNIPAWVKKRFSKWKSETPIELPPKPKPKDGSGSNEPLWAMAIGALGTRFRRRKATGGASAKLRPLALLSLVLTVVAFATGCSCDDDDNKQTCKPCVPASQQSKGCLYKVCMTSVYMCINQAGTGFSNGDKHKVVTGDQLKQIDKWDGADDWGAGDAVAIGVLTATTGVGGLIYGGVKGFSGNDDYSCLEPTDANDDKMYDVFAGKVVACPLHASDKFLDELQNAGKDQWETFKSGHGVKEVTIDEARNTCKDIAGIQKIKNRAEYGASAAEDNNIGKLEAGRKKAFQERLTKRMQNDQDQSSVKNATKNSASDPSCASADPENGPDAGAGSGGNSGAEGLADARGGFGGAPVEGGKKDAAKDKQASNAATAKDKDGIPKPINLGKDDKKGPGAPIALGRAAGNGTTSGGGGSATGAFSAGGLAGFAADAEEKDAAVTAEGTDFAAAGQNTGKGGGAAAANPFAGLFGGAAAGPQGGVGNVGFGGEVKPGGDEKTNEDGLLTNTKLSLFEIVNRRMDKFGDAK